MLWRNAECYAEVVRPKLRGRTSAVQKLKYLGDKLTAQWKAVEAWSRADLLRAVSVMVVIAGWAVALIWLTYFIRFSSAYSVVFGAESTEHVVNAKAAWGQLGDFVGGTLNPLLSGLTLVGLVFTILLQHEAMMRVQSDGNKNIASMKEQSELSLIGARLQALTAALDVITEMHRQAVLACDPSVVELLSKKERLASDILEINEALKNRAA